MITKDQIETLLEHPVYDAEGTKIGDAKHVFLDDATDSPEWVSVKTGMFGMSESFVPLRDARIVEDHLEVPFPKDKVKDAPNVDVEGGRHLSSDEEHRLYDHYGLAWDESWQRANEPGEGGWAHGDAGTDTTGTAGAAGTAGLAGTAAGDRSYGARDTGTGADREGRRRDTGDAMTRSEEEMHVGTERVEVGRARLRKYVVTENVQQTVPVRHEEVRVVREPITEANRDAAMAGPEISEAEHEVTLHAERPVVATEAVAVERVRLDTEEVVEEETVTGEIRKERIETEGVDPVTRDNDSGGRGRHRRP